MKNKKYLKNILIVIFVIVLVNVGGFIFFSGFSFQKTQPGKPAQDWAKYKNSQYGFEVKYPPFWQPVESKDGVIINPLDAGGNVYFGVSADGRTLQDIKTVVAGSNIVTTDVEVGGDPGFEYTDYSAHRAVFVSHKNQTFIIRIYASLGGNTQANQILASLKFTK